MAIKFLFGKFYKKKRFFLRVKKKINKFKPKKYQSNTNNMIKLIEDYIDKGVKPC